MKTLINAIKKGFFATFPGLDVKTVRKHLPKSVPTAKGYMKKIRKNLQSTGNALISSTNNAHEMTELDFHKGPNSRTYLMTCKVIEIPAPSNTTATDQTGRFLHWSSLGNLYVMVAYVRDANAIIAVPTKNRAEATLVSAYTQIYDGLCDQGLHPKLQITNNECPKA